MYIHIHSATTHEAFGLVNRQMHGNMFPCFFNIRQCKGTHDGIHISSLPDGTPNSKLWIFAIQQQTICKKTFGDLEGGEPKV